MRFSNIVAALLPVGAALASVHNVSVGFNNTLTYNPSSINASEGDTVLFIFESKNHTVTQSTLAKPCENISTPDPVDSGFQPVASDAAMLPMFNYTVLNASAPLWFYCRQTGHCEQGMVFAINPAPSGAKSFAAFQAVANASNPTTGAPASANSSSTSSSSSSAQTSTTTANGAGAVRFGGAAGVLAVLGVAAGVLL